MGLNIKRKIDKHGLIWGINTIYLGGSHWLQWSWKNISLGPRHCLYCPRLCLGQYRQCLGPCDIFTILSAAAPWTIYFHIHLTNYILLDIYTNKVRSKLQTTILFSKAIPIERIISSSPQTYFFGLLRYLENQIFLQVLNIYRQKATTYSFYFDQIFLYHKS